MRIIKLIALSALMTIPNLAQAADAAPTADMVRQVMSYFRDGNTAILVEAKLCKEIGKEGDTKNECVDEITGGKVNKGDKAYVWLNFFVPGENSDAKNVLVQFSSKGMVLQSKQLHMKQTTRYRTWYPLPTNKDGEWDITASQEQADSYQKIGGLTYTVEEAAAAPAAQ